MKELRRRVRRFQSCRFLCVFLLLVALLTAAAAAAAAAVVCHIFE